VESGLDEADSSPFADAVEGLIVGSEDFVDRIKGLLVKRGVDKAVPALDRLRIRPSLKGIVDVALRQLGSESEQWQWRRTYVVVAMGMGAPRSPRHWGLPMYRV